MADAASDATAAAEENGEAARDALLTPAGFDYDKVIAMIEDSSMEATQKALLVTTLGQARDNPALLEATLKRIKDALPQ
ncbi:hypothetical protein [Phaeobacter sp. A36a-5a]|uniref:hypothetical protein n=1 Tax=Phaeobacter bryozoorum TaxID=1086632 RepID=UPI0035A69ACC